MKIYTKTGDDGTTMLFGGKRVQKSSARITAYGTIDELNSFTGFAVALCKDENVKEVLQDIQNKLFVVGSDLATPEDLGKNVKIQRTPESFITDAEKYIDKFDQELEPLRNFILPGGSQSAAVLHICRTVSRRAEREVVALNNQVKLGNNILIFLNRISDLFFVLARYENKKAGFADIIWKT
ncbi:MAG: cob(I)yrinic acid a,c-diamide adenosyltransferase [Ignavibacteriaceae bacterium]